MHVNDVDAELLIRVKNNDQTAYTKLMQKYQSKIARVVGRMLRDSMDDIDDCVQETFIKAFKALPNFRGDSTFYTWLYRIAINVAKNQITTNIRQRKNICNNPTNVDGDSDEILDMYDMVPDLATPENTLMAEELEAKIKESIEGLPEELQKCIYLREFDGYTYLDIAVEMETPIGTVRSRIFRARENIAADIRPLRDSTRGKRW